MNKTAKIIVAILITAGSGLLIYFGAYLPIVKSVMYIDAYSQLGNLHSLGDFNKIFDPALDFYSPVGQEELVSAYLGIIIDIFNQKNGPSKDVADLLVRQAEARATSLLQEPGGFSYSQNFLKLGLVYKLAAIKFNDQIHYQRSVELLQEGLSHSPNRPVFLYNLLDIYLWKGDTEGTKEISQVILRNWPNDQRVSRILEAINSGKVRGGQ